MIIKGCPNCGKHSFTFNVKFCPWCNAKLVIGEKSWFEEINALYAKRIYELNDNKKDQIK